jgi:hypothetical protein
MLVSEAIDRTFSEWLEVAGANRSAYDILESDIDASITTVTVTSHHENIPDDAVLEIDSEVLLNQTTDHTVSPIELTINERGFRNTTPAAHTAGTKVYVAPDYFRKNVFNAIVSVIGNLYPTIYAVAFDTSQSFTTRRSLELPAEAKDILSILVEKDLTTKPPYRLVAGKQWEPFREYEPPRLMLQHGGSEGDDMRIVYSRDFVLPTDESDDLTDDCLVSATLAPYIPMAAAGYLLQGKEIPRVQIEEIKRLLATEGVQVGAQLNIGQTLMQVFDRKYVLAERSRLLDRFPVGWEYVR